MNQARLEMNQVHLETNQVYLKMNQAIGKCVKPSGKRDLWKMRDVKMKLNPDKAKNFRVGWLRISLPARQWVRSAGDTSQ